MSLIKNNYGWIWDSIYKLKNKIYLLEAPSYVQWVATHQCNYNCEHCGTSAGNPLKDELSTNEVINIVSDMASMGVKYFSVTGGEPLFRSDLFEILAFAKEKGLKVGFVTNGSLVSKFQDNIRKLKPFSMTVSIDGLKETHNNLRNDNLNFDNSLRAIRFFNEINIPIISVTTTVNKKNIDELDNLKNIVFYSGANRWRINIAIPEGRAKNKEWMYLDNNQFLRLFKFIEINRKEFNIEICEGAGYLGEWDTKLKDYKFFCGCGLNTCTIMADGTVIGCPIFENQEEHSEGNIRDTSFKEIWENKFERFRNLKLPNDCNSCRHVNACRGGCWMMRIFDAHCLKNVWE